MHARFAGFQPTMSPDFQGVTMLNLISFLVLATPSAAFAAADLVPTVRVTGVALLRADGAYLVPVRVSVRNSGTEIAGRFKMSVEFNHLSFGGTRVTAFGAASSSDGSFTRDGFYVWTSRALFPGRSLTFNGSVLIPSSVPRRSQITLRVVADSCSGEEFMPALCRVPELREDNNRTSLQTANLP